MVLAADLREVAAEGQRLRLGNFGEDKFPGLLLRAGDGINDVMSVHSLIINSQVRPTNLFTLLPYHFCGFYCDVGVPDMTMLSRSLAIPGIC